MKSKKREALAGVLVVLSLFLTTGILRAQDEVAQENTSGDTSSLDMALGRVPEADRNNISDALSIAGDNSTALINAIVSCPDSWLPGAIFLVENMPMEDLAVVTEDGLIENIRMAYQVRADFPWTARLTESDFLHYVLPMRVSQEPLENWRGYFLEQLRPRIENLATLDDVALEVNRWCGERVGFKPTQRRDQGPFETLASGYGRCEEMMIVYIDACRAVGVPARQAWTPYWGFTDNNHAWAEVMGEDGKWHYVGACEPSDRLDDAWFNESVRRANLVFSVPFGLPDSGETDIYRIQEEPGARYSILNSIEFYRPSTELRISVFDLSGNPLPETSVYLYVFNFGALRPIAKGETDENGFWSMTVGPGGYFISAGDENSGVCEPLQVEGTDPIEITLTVGLGAELPPGDFWLRYPDEEVSE
jgi:hypothetical protein